MTTNIWVMMMFMNVGFSGSFIQSAARNSLPSSLHSTNFPVPKVIIITRNISFYILITLLFIMNISLSPIMTGPPANAGADVAPINNNAAKSFIGFVQLIIIYTKKERMSILSMPLIDLSLHKMLCRSMH